MNLRSDLWHYIVGTSGIFLRAVPLLLGIGFIAFSLYGCAGTGCCISLTNDSKETISYLVIGIGYVTVPKSEQATAATVTKLYALGVLNTVRSRFRKKYRYMSNFQINWGLLLPLLVTSVVAVFGWIVGHRLNAERDLHNKRVELRIKFLLEAYRKLEASIEQEINRENLNVLESAISDIQLLGSPEQVDKVLDWSKQFSKKETQKGCQLTGPTGRFEKKFEKGIRLAAHRQKN